MTTYDERITTYFGDAVLRAGFMPVPHLLMRHYRALDLLSEHAMFAMQLMEITWDLAQPPATMRRIADRMGISVRTAQRYSEYLAARGLIVIYEQFEEGAQVENGYDLAPLFRALAAFAPEPRPGGIPRERRQRTGGSLIPAAQPSTAAASDTASPHQPGLERSSYHDSAVPLRRVVHDTPTPDTNVTGGGVRNDTPPGDNFDTRGGDPGVAPPGDRSDTPGMTQLSGLKGKQESPKKQQEQAGGAVRLRAKDQAGAQKERPRAATEAVGRSLRSERELTAPEVARSGRLLDALGLHSPVARACARTLEAAEVLSLAAYARAAGLGTAWIAAQIFDFERRAPRMADLARRWDDTGTLLAAVDDETALRLLDLVDRHAPDAPDALTGDPCYNAGNAALRAAAAALWAMMHDLRGGGSTRELAVAPTSAEVERGTADLWCAVLERVRGEVARADYETWLVPARLLVLENRVAVVGADNVFAREQIQQAHSEALGRAFAAELGSAIRVDVVIG